MECRASQDVHRLLTLYLTSPATPVKIIPIITTAQIKSNILKAKLESLINARIMETQQGCGMDSAEPLDSVILESKTDGELRQLLALLREKECEERVNVNFAAYSSQKFVAESRLYNVQRKICQIEQTMDKRRNKYANVNHHFVKAFSQNKTYHSCVGSEINFSRNFLLRIFNYKQHKKKRKEKKKGNKKKKLCNLEL